MTSTALSIAGLTVEFPTPRGVVHALTDVTLDVGCGEFLGVVGESGCGKTTLALAVLSILPATTTVLGTIRLDDEDLLGMTGRELRAVRGARIGYVPQDPLAALDPTFAVGKQITETIRAHRPVSRSEARAEALRLMAEVGIPDPARCYRLAPHELSGGLRQRITIAIAMANNPALIIADEPTTALDTTIAQQILTLLKRLAAKNGTSVVFITHDLAVVSQYCDRVAVLYAGRLAEVGDLPETVRAPRHPYTQALLRSMPSAAIVRGGLEVIPGEVRDPHHPGPGCQFAPRCPGYASPCDTEQPLLDIEPGHAAACWRAEVTTG